MMDFKTFFSETLRVADARARGQLQAHPLVQNGTFGVEIEFKVLGLPEKEWDHDALVNDLDGTTFEQDLQQKHGGEEGEDPETGESQYVSMSRKDWYRFFDQYIRTHKDEAVAAWMDNYKEKTDSHMWQGIKGFWKREAKRAIEGAGFRVYGDQASGQNWGVGEDGLDTDDSRPVIEVRSGIMTPKDFPALEQVLLGFQKLFRGYKSYVQVAGNTGLHVHVSNPAMNRPEGVDPFTRLASLASVDEDQIWDDQLPHDRSFERFALLNKQQDFSSYRDKGFHRGVIELVRYNMRPAGVPTSPTPRRFTNTVTTAELAAWTQGLERNAGVNVKSEHPTVEYRQLSSALLADPQGPAKVLDYIRYFMENTAGLSNKNQFRVQDGDDRVTFTRLPGGARVDFEKLGNDAQRFDRVPQAGDGAEDMRKFPRTARPDWMPGRYAPFGPASPGRRIRPPRPSA